MDLQGYTKAHKQPYPFNSLDIMITCDKQSLKTLNKFELSMGLIFEIKYISLHQIPENNRKIIDSGKSFSGIFRENTYLWLWPFSQGLKTLTDISMLKQLV